MPKRKLNLTTPKIDALVIFGVALCLLAYFISVEAFDYVVRFSATHERWEIDEVLVTLMIMPVAFGVFAYRRLKETRVELRLRRAAEKQAQAMSLHDPLTGLPNRRKAMIDLTHAIAGAEDRPVTLLLSDLNRFKATNDLYGHSAGDRLLLASGERFRRAVGSEASVCRLGGDEFLVILRGAIAEDDLLQMLTNLTNAFEQPFTADGHEILIGAAIGVSQTSDPAIATEKFMAQADAAMYRAKAAGRSAFHFFEEGMEMAAVRRARVERDLRLAIAAGSVEPFFQPLVRMSDGKVLGFEALARWREGDDLRLEPSEFIPIAEAAGIINDLYFMVLEKTAIAMRSWPPDWTASINVSPVQFRDEWLVQRTLQVVTRMGIAPGRFDIEITETALLDNIELAQSVIESFKECGFRVALDDFGTGYSSLRHLSEIRFDKLKIDRSFVTNIDQNSSSQTIVRTITAMAHNLGLEVTVEGVETRDEAMMVSAFGCDVAQGFLYGMPDPQVVYGPLLVDKRGERDAVAPVG